MKRDFNAIIIGLNGKPLRQMELMGQDDKGNDIKVASDFTFRAAAVEALTQLYQDERLDGNEKVRRFLLAERIYGADGPVEVSSEDITLIKTLITKLFDPVVVGRTYAFLEAD